MFKVLAALAVLCGLLIVPTVHADSAAPVETSVQQQGCPIFTSSRIKKLRGLKFHAVLLYRHCNNADWVRQAGIDIVPLKGHTCAGTTAVKVNPDNIGTKDPATKSISCPKAKKTFIWTIDEAVLHSASKDKRTLTFKVTVVFLGNPEVIYLDTHLI